MNNVIAFLRIVGVFGYHYCGYVGIKENDKVPRSLQGGGTGYTLDDEISVHGGITFDGHFNQENSIIPITNIPEDWYTYHCYGFDLNHYNDICSGINMDFEYAKKEVIRMKEQMEALLDRISPSTGN